METTVDTKSFYKNPKDPSTHDRSYVGFYVGAESEDFKFFEPPLESTFDKLL